MTPASAETSDVPPVTPSSDGTAKQGIPTNGSAMAGSSSSPYAVPATGAAGSPIPGLPAKGPVQETVIYEGGPARGDLIFGLVLAITLVGIPLAVGAIVRALWLRYRITTRRIEVNGGWLGRDRSQVVYSQIREVRSVPRGFGAWGDMVLVLNDGSKLEMRSVPRFREIEARIEELRQSKTSKATKPSSGFAKPQAPAA